MISLKEVTSRFFKKDTEIEIGSVWISKLDLKENPFEKSAWLDRVKVVRIKKGLGNGSNKTFLWLEKNNSLRNKNFSIDKELFEDRYVLLTDELSKEWNLE